MRRHFLLIVFSLLSIVISAQHKKAVFIIVDGIPADVIEKLPTPAMDAIAGKEGYKRALVGGERGGYSETPTISAVGYNSVLTGTWVNKHNVRGNYGDDIAKPNYHYKSVFRVLKDARPSDTIAVFSSWLDNRTKLVGERLPATGNIAVDIKYDSLEYDTITYPKDTTSLRMLHIDEAVANKAAETIRTQAPDLSWVYLEYTDDMGHTFGDSPQFYEAVKTMDQQMSRIWKAIQYRQQKFREDWLVIITTDHGRDSATGKHHGGQSDRERSGWIATNAKDLNQHFKSGKPSIADIMPTIARFMQIEIPRKDAMEIDGISITGRVDISHPTARLDNGRIIVTWNNLNKNGDVRLWLATTNNFKTEAEDEYKLVLSVPVKRRRAEIKVSNLKSNFYKVVFETPNQYLNRWVIQKKNP